MSELVIESNNETELLENNNDTSDKVNDETEVNETVEEYNDNESNNDDETSSMYENESNLDSFNFDELTSDDSEEDDSNDDSEEDSLDSDDDYDDAEFNFDDVKDSIEYIQERYNFFKKTNVQECNLYLLYVEKNEVINVEKILFDLNDDGSVDKDKIVELLQDKRIKNDNKYFIKDLWQYNFNLNYNDLINLFDEDEEFESIENMMKPLTKLSNISFDESIDVFKDKNSLFVLYSLEKPERKTKRRKSLKKNVSKTSRKTHKKEKN